ncbi:MAG: hypothetical protein MR832_11450, partial [Clostridiales bacterium]|nr:hypothetical protein [Clostridiales bacterium]
MKTNCRLLFRSFLYLLIALWLPVTAFLAVQGVRGIREERAAYEAAQRDAADKYADRIASCFSDLTENANRIFLSRWYAHYMNASGIYRDEFDELKKTEISAGLRTIACTADFVCDILVLSPDHDAVITSIGWYSSRDYARYYADDAQIRFNGGEASVTPAENRRCLLLSDVTPRMHEGYVCILFDAEALSGFVRDSLPDGLADVCVSVRGETWVAPEGALEEDALGVTRSALPGVRFSFSAVPYSDERLPYRLTGLALELVAVTLLLAAAAYLTTLVFFRPVSRLLTRFTRGESRSIHEAVFHIGEFFDALSYQNVELSDENHSLKCTIDAFVQQRETEMLLSLLLKPPQDGGTGMPLPAAWQDGRFLLCLSGTDSFPASVPGFAGVHVLRLLPNECCAVCLLEDGVSAADACAAFDRAQSGDGSLRSGVICGASRLHDEFIMLQRAREMQYETERTLPSGVQLAMLAHIRSGRADDCRALIERHRAQHPPEQFFLFLLRIAFENGADTARQRRFFLQNAENPDEQYRIVLELASQLSRQSAADRKQSADSAAGLMKAYIDENFANPELSVKHL